MDLLSAVRAREWIFCCGPASASFVARSGGQHLHAGEIVTHETTLVMAPAMWPWGRVAVRASRGFNLKTDAGTVQGIPHRFCIRMQRADGYGYLRLPYSSQAKAVIAAQSAPFLPGLNAGVSRSTI